MTTKTTPLDRLRLEASKYAAVIQTTRSTPSGTQLTQYPSSRETIRQRNFNPSARLPHFIGRCSTKTRAGPLARSYPRWTLREMFPESCTIGEVRKPRIPLDTLVPQTGAADRSGGLNNFVESRWQNFREVRSVPVKRHQNKANARPKANNEIIRESSGIVAQTGDLVLVRESSSNNVAQDGSGGKLEHERGMGPWKLTKVVGADLIVMEGRNTRTRHVSPRGIKPFHARPPDLRHPLADEFAQICMASRIWTNHPIRSS